MSHPIIEHLKRMFGWQPEREHYGLPWPKRVFDYSAWTAEPLQAVAGVWSNIHHLGRSLRSSRRAALGSWAALRCGR
jgi:hypothetical protein